MGLSRKAWFGALLFAVTVVSTQSFVYDSKTDRFCRLNTMCFEKQPTTASSTNGDNNKDDTAVVKRKTWNPLRLAVLRLGLTEPAMTSALNYGQYDNGNFFCAYCGHALFDSNAKYDSGSGWPSFWRSKDEGSVSYQREWDGRLEVQCQKCHSHLGHVFLDGPKRVDMQLLETAPKSDPRGSKPNAPLPRFCVNGAALTYRKNAQ